MSQIGQKCPKRLRLPAGKSIHEHMGRIVPNRDTGQVHSIISSAVASNTGGTEIPSASAVLTLITGSDLSDSCIGN
jgi:hypothetical protein